MLKRYSRNIKTLTELENESLKDKRVCIIGCGGLGGYIIEMLARIGAGHLTVVDGDVFDESNLNRQLLCDEASIGINKAKKAAKRINEVNSLISVNYIDEFFNEENGINIIKNHDVVVDALDNIETRKLLQGICESLEIPLVYGAIAGWYGQVTTIFPGDKTLDILYPKEDKISRGSEQKLGNPSFTPALVASIQVSEVIKVLIRRGDLLRKKVLYIDLLSQDYEIIEF